LQAIAGQARNDKKCSIPLHFSTFEYSFPKNIFTKEPMNIDEKFNFLVVTGVVNADGLYRYLEQFALSVDKMKFPDHHDFSEMDIKNIDRRWREVATRACNIQGTGYKPAPAENDTLIITTEKDRSRLLSNPFISDNLKEKIFYVEIEVKVTGNR
jgi:tetraacyldisaccharide 4'-kinase